jgi:hypothetical protein
MKAALLLAVLLAARLALACGAWAQDVGTAGGPVPPRLEIGGTVGTTWFTPSVGLLVSAPAWRRTSVEGGINLARYERFVQGQLRVPFGAGPGARRSLIVGLTHLSPRGTMAGVHQPGLAAHAGMSAQAPLGRRLDLRADVQMLAPFGDGPDAELRAAVAIVWHR